MTKIKKYGIASLVINGIFALGGGVAFVYALKAMREFEWTGPDLSEYGEMSMLILGLVGAAMMIAIIVPLVHLAVGAFNSLMMLLQVLTGKKGFSVLPIIASALLVLIDGALMAVGLYVVFVPLIALSLASMVLNIKSLEKTKEVVTE